MGDISKGAKAHYSPPRKFFFVKQACSLHSSHWVPNQLGVSLPNDKVDVRYQSTGVDL
jgi:hypothetical protein